MASLNDTVAMASQNDSLPTARPTANSLPTEVLTLILGHVDQATRAACLLASKHVHRAASAPELWDTLRIRELDAESTASAVQAVVRHKSSRLRIQNDRPDDAATFLHRVVNAGAGDGVEHLEIQMGRVSRVPEDLLVAATRLWNLRSLVVEAREVKHACMLMFHTHLPLGRLHTLRITEALSTNVSVNFAEDSFLKFKALECVELRVGVSNVLDDARLMDKLRYLVYRCDEEAEETHTYARLNGLRLAHLELDVGVDTDYARLYYELGRCAVERLVLHLHDDHLQIRNVNAALTQLAIGFHETHAEVVLDFTELVGGYPALRSIETFIAADWILADQGMLDSCHHTVRITNARFQDFMDYAQRVPMQLHADHVVVTRD